MAPQPKIFGFKLPSVVTDGSCVSVTLQFPNILEYRAAFNGQINMLGKWFQWAHTQADYQDIPEFNQEVAELWVEVLASAQWGECMTFCEQLIECLTTDTDVQDAIAGLIATNDAIRDALREFVLTDEAINEFIIDKARVPSITIDEQAMNLLKPGECNYDFIFNQTTVLVDLLNTLSEDFLQALIVGTNPLERGQILLSAIPAIGALIPFDEIMQFANELVEDIQEEYQNKYDEALEDELRCGLFCLFRDDCEISISDAMLFYLDLAGETLPAEPAEALQATIQILLAGVLPGNWIVYMMHAFVLACIQAGQEVIGVDFAHMGIRIVAAGDEPNNDWMTICVECPPEPVECEGALYSWDFRVSDGGYAETVAGYAIYEPAVGWGYGSFAFVIGIDKVVSGSYQRVKIYLSLEEANTLFLRNNYAGGWASYSYTVNSTGTEDGLYFYDINVDTPITDGFSVQYFTNDPDQHIVRICLFEDPL